MSGDLENRKRKFDEIFKDYEDEIKELQGSNYCLNVENARLQSEIDSLRSENTQSEIIALRAENSSLRATQQAEGTILKLTNEELTTENNALHESIKILKQQLETMQQDRKKLITTEISVIKALNKINRFGGIDGSHHKMWIGSMFYSRC